MPNNNVAPHTPIPATIDYAVIDHYVAKGRRERSRAFVGLIKALFAPSTTVDETPVRQPLKPATV